jgi:hypothetical protein
MLAINSQVFMLNLPTLAAKKSPLCMSKSPFVTAKSPFVKIRISHGKNPMFTVTWWTSVPRFGCPGAVLRAFEDPLHGIPVRLIVGGGEAEGLVGL